MVYKDSFHPEGKEKFKALVANKENKAKSFDVVFTALEAYKTVNGDLNVPAKFVISEGDDRYPADTWGMKLGNNVHGIRSSGVYSEHRAKLEELGFCFELVKITRWDFLTQIYPSLQAYNTIAGNLKVSRNFVVPEGDHRYPVDSWGMKLGLIANDIRHGREYVQFKERLTALGFYEHSSADVKFAKIYSALKAYKTINGSLLVPQRFIVPEGDAHYPVDTWGMKLGSAVSSIRNYDTYSERRPKLEELGFVYRDVKPVVEIV
jgi:hypothetical protein